MTAETFQDHILALMQAEEVRTTGQGGGTQPAIRGVLVALENFLREDGYQRAMNAQNAQHLARLSDSHFNIECAHPVVKTDETDEWYGERVRTRYTDYCARCGEVFGVDY